MSLTKRKKSRGHTAKVLTIMRLLLTLLSQFIIVCNIWYGFGILHLRIILVKVTCHRNKNVHWVWPNDLVTLTGFSWNFIGAVSVCIELALFVFILYLIRRNKKILFRISVVFEIDIVKTLTLRFSLWSWQQLLYTSIYLLAFQKKLWSFLGD